jgi:endoglucanase
MGTGGDAATETGTGSSGGGNGDGGSATGLSVSYQVGPSGATSAYIGSELQITNNTAPATDVSSLKLRYYYTDEVKVMLQMTIQWQHIHQASGPDIPDLTTSSTFGTVSPAAATADSYVEFSFSSSSHPSLGMGEAVVFSWQMQGPDPAQDVYTQTNDYSFDASKGSLTSWSNVVLLQNGSVIWGATP